MKAATAMTLATHTALPSDSVKMSLIHFMQLFSLVQKALVFHSFAAGYRSILINKRMNTTNPNKETFWGNPCKNIEHSNADGKTLRDANQYRCLACYKEYQREYHAALRRDRPEKLKQYMATQEAKGNDWRKYYRKEEK